MACARGHQPLGQVRGDRDERSSAIIYDQSEFTVTRELSEGDSENLYRGLNIFYFNLFLFAEYIFSINFTLKWLPKFNADSCC